MATLGATIIRLSQTVRETRLVSSHTMIASEEAVYELLQNDREALHHFHQASQLKHAFPQRFTPTRHNPHFARGGKRRSSKSPVKKEKKSGAKSPKKSFSSSSSCGPDCSFPQARFRDDDDPQDPPLCQTPFLLNALVPIC